MTPALLTRGMAHALQAVIRRMGLDEKRLKQAFKRRPLLSLFLGMFIVCSALPLLTFLLFVGGIVCVGMFLWVVAEVSTIAMATITLALMLVLPACFAGGVSALAYMTYLALVRMRGALQSAVTLPQKLWREAALREAMSEKKVSNGKTSKGNLHHGKRSGLYLLHKAVIDDPGSDSEDEEPGFAGNRPLRLLKNVPKGPFTAASERDLVRA